MAWCALLSLTLQILTLSPSWAKDDEDDEDEETDRTPSQAPQNQNPQDRFVVKGFYYDAETDRYFSNGKAQFSIRPIGEKTYLEHIEVSIDNSSFERYQGPLHFEKEGAHSVRFRASDPVLNWSPTQHFRIFVDLTPPQSHMSWQGPHFEKNQIVYIHPSTFLSMNAQDTLSGVKALLWKRGDQITPVPNKLQFQKAGNYVVRLSAIDHVGNQEQWQDFKFVVDPDAPQTAAKVLGQSFRADQNLYVSSGSVIVLDGHDEGAGIKNIEYQINGTNVMSYEGPIAVHGKKFDLKYRAIDEVGNEEKWKSIVVHQDTLPPELNVKTIGQAILIGGTLYAQKSFAIEVQVSDADSGVKELAITKDGKSYEPTKQNRFVFTNTGEYFIGIRARDLVDNYRDSNPYRVVIDQTPPISKLKPRESLAERDGVFLSGLPNQIDFSADDKGVGLDRIELSFDGNNFSPVKQPIDLSSWQEAKRTFYYRAVDLLGNAEQTQKMTVMVRTKGPSVDLFVESQDYPKVPLSALRKGSVSSETERLPAESPHVSHPTRSEASSKHSSKTSSTSTKTSKKPHSKPTRSRK